MPQQNNNKFKKILIGLAFITVVAAIILVIIIAVDAYNEEMERKFIIQSNIEEQARIEAENEARRKAEEYRQ